MKGDDEIVSLAESVGVEPDLTRTLVHLHGQIATDVRRQLVHAVTEELAAEHGERHGDVVYGIDLPAEKAIEAAFANIRVPVSVVAEGLGGRIFPTPTGSGSPAYKVIIDPVDGSRELMYDKRSAFVLSGVAPDRGEATTLADIVFGLMTELPPARQQLAAQAWAGKGAGAFERLIDADTGAPRSSGRALRSSRASSIRGGFACFVSYFPGTHGPIGEFADSVLEAVLGSPEEGRAAAFNDTYVSSGGQLYLLASGKYRLVADLRPLFGMGPRGRSLCAHPYDLASAIIASEAGAVLEDAGGAALHYPLDTATDCAFVAYANEAIRDETRHAIRRELRRHAQK